MTSIVAITRKDSIWLVADRRLSANGRAVRDDARKIMILETTDGVAILGYTGLGATKAGTEPSDWMQGVLRGRNLTLEASLTALAEAIQAEVPRHLGGLAKLRHTVIAPAFLGDRATLYTIDLVPVRGAKPRIELKRQAMSGTNIDPPAIVAGGSGAPCVVRRRGELRAILKTVKAYDRGLVTQWAVSDLLAAMNEDVHSAVKTVGNRCIVVWRNRKEGFRKGGGGHQFYTGRARDRSSDALPTLTNGMNISGIADGLMSLMVAQMGPDWRGQAFQHDQKKLDEAMAKVPHTPDPKLR